MTHRHVKIGRMKKLLHVTWADSPVDRHGDHGAEEQERGDHGSDGVREGATFYHGIDKKVRHEGDNRDHGAHKTDWVHPRW